MSSIFGKGLTIKKGDSKETIRKGHFYSKTWWITSPVRVEESRLVQLFSVVSLHSNGYITRDSYILNLKL